MLLSPNPTKKLTDQDWDVIKALYCAGEKAHIIAKRFNCSAAHIRKTACVQKWPTPQRISRAVKTGATATNDPAAALAELWETRKQQSREATYQGAQKALQRFFSMSPVPQNFSEAAIAQKMIDKAIDPSEGKSQPANVNLALLTGDSFSPRVIDV